MGFVYRYRVRHDEHDFLRASAPRAGVTVGQPRQGVAVGQRTAAEAAYQHWGSSASHRLRSGIPPGAWKVSCHTDHGYDADNRSRHAAGHPATRVTALRRAGKRPLCASTGTRRAPWCRNALDDPPQMGLGRRSLHRAPHHLVLPAASATGRHGATSPAMRALFAQRSSVAEFCLGPY